MPSVRAVIFDLGSTLLFFQGDWPDVYARADQALYAYLNEAGLEVDQIAFLDQFRARLSAYYEQRKHDLVEQTTRNLLRSQLAAMGIEEVAEEVIAEGIRRLYRVSQQHWHLEEDAVETLEYLRANGRRLGIVSNAGDDEDVQTLVNNAGFRPYFDFIISSAAEGVRKPHPQIFQTALDHWGFLPEEVIMVGDTLEADILGAQQVGIFGVWITRRADPLPDSSAEQIQPDAAIERLTDLPDLIGSLSKSV